MGKYVVGITGASGSIYAKRLIDKLIELEHDVYVCITSAGKMVLESELKWDFEQKHSNKEIEYYLREIFKNHERIHYFDVRDIAASIASGSFLMDGMIVVPCSMGTLSAISKGMSDNLIERAADVCLKERRKLVIVPREAPYNKIHLKNMLELLECGAIIMPASPSFYSNPNSIEELVDYLVIRILDQLDIKLDTKNRWNGFENNI